MIHLFHPAPLSNDQETDFIHLVENNFKKYLWWLVLAVGIFQIYNIGYVLHYNIGRDFSTASTVYLILYILLLIASAAAILLLHFHHLWPKLRILSIQYGYVLFLVAWAIAITSYDQRVSNNISVYLLVSMSIAILAYLPPKFSFPLFGFGYLLLLIGISLFGAPFDSDYYGRFVNLFTMSVTAMFISYYHYYSQRKNFQNHCIISEQNREILKKSAELNYLAHHDPMTGLLNQRFLATYLQTDIYPYPDKSLAVFMMDIDDFKSYNDQFGHLEGDQCLIRIAKAIALQISAGMLFRYGGEEFLYLVPNLSAADAADLGEKLRHTVERLQISNAKENSVVTISIGCVHGKASNQDSWKVLLQQADNALYDAKRNGKNQVCTWSESVPLSDKANP